MTAVALPGGQQCVRQQRQNARLASCVAKSGLDQRRLDRHPSAGVGLGDHCAQLPFGHGADQYLPSCRAATRAGMSPQRA
jgi:hypothetical protein